MNGYRTDKGMCITGDSLSLLKDLKDNSVNLVVTSPPYPLLRQKSYGNVEQEEYISWLCQFGELVHSKLTEDGSFVIDLGASYNRGSPTYSLYQFGSSSKCVMKSASIWHSRFIGITPPPFRRPLNGSTSESCGRRIASIPCGGCPRPNGPRRI